MKCHHGAKESVMVSTMKEDIVRMRELHTHGRVSASIAALACLAVFIVITVAGCGGSSKPASHPAPAIMSVTGGWYGVPTSVTGEVAAQITNTSRAPVSFELENFWEQTVKNSVGGIFTNEAARLKGGSAGSILVTNPAVVATGPVAPGKTVEVNMIVTVQEPGKADGYTKVVGTEPSTGAKTVRIIPW